MARPVQPAMVPAAPINEASQPFVMPVLPVAEVTAQDFFAALGVIPADALTSYKEYTEECERRRLPLLIHIRQWMEWLAYKQDIPNRIPRPECSPVGLNAELQRSPQ